MVLDKIREIIAEKLEVDIEEVKPESSFDDLHADSLYMIEIMMAIEEEFDISIEDGQDMQTVSDIAAYVEEKLA